MSLKATIKDTLHRLGLASLLDKLIFIQQGVKFRKRNSAFKKEHPNFKIPPDYFLYETHLLSYYNHMNSGDLTAKEIVDWSSEYIDNIDNVLEWGCGVARVVRHLPKYLSKESKVYGCDINPSMIEWDISNIPDINFSLSSYLPPLTYRDNQFDVVYAYSIFTHIEAEYQLDWIKEIHRIIKPGGIFLFTTMGDRMLHQLLPYERRKLEAESIYTKSYKQKGHRLMSTYHVAKDFRQQITPYFKVLEFWDNDYQKAALQDLWIVQRL